MILLYYFILTIILLTELSSSSFSLIDKYIHESDVSGGLESDIAGGLESDIAGGVESDIAGVPAVSDVSGVHGVSDVSGVHGVSDVSGVHGGSDISGRHPESISDSIVGSSLIVGNSVGLSTSCFDSSRPSRWTDIIVEEGTVDIQYFEWKFYTHCWPDGKGLLISLDSFPEGLESISSDNNDENDFPLTYHYYPKESSSGGGSGGGSSSSSDSSVNVIRIPLDVSKMKIGEYSMRIYVFGLFETIGGRYFPVKIKIYNNENLLKSKYLKYPLRIFESFSSRLMGPKNNIKYFDQSYHYDLIDDYYDGKIFPYPHHYTIANGNWGTPISQEENFIQNELNGSHLKKFSEYSNITIFTLGYFDLISSDFENTIKNMITRYDTSQSQKQMILNSQYEIQTSDGTSTVILPKWFTIYNSITSKIEPINTPQGNGEKLLTIQMFSTISDEILNSIDENILQSLPPLGWSLSDKWIPKINQECDELIQDKMIDFCALIFQGGPENDQYNINDVINDNSNNSNSFRKVLLQLSKNFKLIFTGSKNRQIHWEDQGRLIVEPKPYGQEVADIIINMDINHPENLDYQVQFTKLKPRQKKGCNEGRSSGAASSPVASSSVAASSSSSVQASSLSSVTGRACRSSRKTGVSLDDEDRSKNSERVENLINIIKKGKIIPPLVGGKISSPGLFRGVDIYGNIRYDKEGSICDFVADGMSLILETDFALIPHHYCQGDLIRPSEWFNSDNLNEIELEIILGKYDSPICEIQITHEQLIVLLQSQWTKKTSIQKAPVATAATHDDDDDDDDDDDADDTDDDDEIQLDDLSLNFLATSKSLTYLYDSSKLEDGENPLINESVIISESLIRGKKRQTDYIAAIPQSLLNNDDKNSFTIKNCYDDIMLSDALIEASYYYDKDHNQNNDHPNSDDDHQNSDDDHQNSDDDSDDDDDMNVLPLARQIDVNELKGYIKIDTEEKDGKISTINIYSIKNIFYKNLIIYFNNIENEIGKIHRLNAFKSRAYKVNQIKQQQNIYSDNQIFYPYSSNRHDDNNDDQDQLIILSEDWEKNDNFIINQFTFKIPKIKSKDSSISLFQKGFLFNGIILIILPTIFS